MCFLSGVLHCVLIRMNMLGRRPRRSVTVRGYGTAVSTYYGPLGVAGVLFGRIGVSFASSPLAHPSEVWDLDLMAGVRPMAEIPDPQKNLFPLLGPFILNSWVFITPHKTTPSHPSIRCGRTGHPAIGRGEAGYQQDGCLALRFQRLGAAAHVRLPRLARHLERSSSEVRSGQRRIVGRGSNSARTVGMLGIDQCTVLLHPAVSYVVVSYVARCVDRTLGAGLHAVRVSSDP